MLNTETKRKINAARDILVGKVPDPKSQVEQITIAMIYKFMDDMDEEAEELGGEPSFFSGEYEKYSWRKIFNPGLGGYDMLNLYSGAIQGMVQNPNLPQLFRDIFKNAYLPYRDPETLKSFLKVINDFSYDHSEKLGDAFEYLLSVLGSQGDAGQFRTPRHVIDFMTALISPKKNETILDPACGTAGFLISAYKHILKENSSNYNDTDTHAFEQNNVKLAEITVNGKHYKGDKLTPDDRTQIIQNIKGYDISPDMVRLSLVNMYLHGFTSPHIYEHDTLTSEERWNEFYDVILANPPFMSPKGGIRPHKRFAIQSKRSEVLFVDYMAEHLTPTGKAAIIVPEGIIFQSGKAYKSLRKMLVDNNYLVGVISLPAGVFNPYSGVKTSILWLDKTLAKKTDKILFAKIENDGFDLGAQRRPIKKNDLPNVFQIITEYQDKLRVGEDVEFENEALSTLVEKEKIAENGEFNLSVERYRNEKILRNTSFPLAQVGEILEFKYGKPLKKVDRKPGDYPVWGSNGIVDFHNEYLAHGPFIVVGRKGSAGALNYSEKSGYPIDTTFYVEDKNPHKINLKFAYYILGTLNLEKINVQAGIPGLNRNDAYRLKIPLPPLSVQEEIVAEIESYQKIIDGARQVVENYKPKIDIDPEWDMVVLGEMCTVVRGSSPRPKGDPRYYGGKVPRLMVSDITRDGMFTIPSTDSLTEEGANKSRPMKKGEVILTVSGNPGLPTILAVDACIHDGFAGFRDLNDKILPEYLYFILLHFKEQHGSLSVGAVFQNLNTNQIRNFKIPLPALKIQQQIISKIKNEIELVNANKQLIEIYEQKIKDRIAKVLGEN